MFGRWYAPLHDSHVYYEVGGVRTYNRNQAIVWAGGDLGKVSFAWHDAVWDKADLTVRPSRSWDSLMRERCVQLRLRHHTLMLSYSGGYDSQTILNYLIRTRCAPDEILILRKTYKDDPESAASLHTLSAMRKLLPKTSVRQVFLHIESTLDVYSELKDDWVLHPTVSETRLVKNHRGVTFNTHPELSALVSAHRGIVDGQEKPFLTVEDGWWVLKAHDQMADAFMNAPLTPFYVSEELPELYIKQCWMAIEWAESKKQFKSDNEARTFMLRAQSARFNELYQEYNEAVGRDRVHNIASWDSAMSSKMDKRGGLYSKDTQAMFARFNLTKDARALRWAGSAASFVKQYPETLMPDSSELRPIYAKSYRIKPVHFGGLHD